MHTNGSLAIAFQMKTRMQGHKYLDKYNKVISSDPPDAIQCTHYMLSKGRPGKLTSELIGLQTGQVVLQKLNLPSLEWH